MSSLVPSSGNMKPILKHYPYLSRALLRQALTMLLLILLLAFGQAVNPTCKKTTVRKEVNDVTDQEWKMIVNTIQKAQRTPEKGDPDGYSVWEAGADLHRELAYGGPNDQGQIHSTCMFFYWHRVFVVEMEKNLQEINPDFFFPYWDSPKQWADADNSPLWNYLGGKGTPVQNDIFNGAKFNIKGYKDPLSRTRLSVNETLVQASLYDRITKRSITRKLGFSGWHEQMEGLHQTIHMQIGGEYELGQMSRMVSPLDPIF